MSKQTTKYWLKLLRTHHAVFSILAGFVVMLWVGLTIFAVMWFKQPQPVSEPVITETGVTIQTYIVQPGDSSWQLAASFLGDGFRYVEIEQANQLVHNQYLEVGQELVIPQDQVDERVTSSDQQLTQSATPLDQIQDQQPSTYIVQPGDSLWQIAQQQYQDGYAWVEVYLANKDLIGSNPGLIYPSTEIVLPSR